MSPLVVCDDCPTEFACIDDGCKRAKAQFVPSGMPFTPSGTVDTLKRDAARYRWLREHETGYGYQTNGGSMWASGETLDEAIDAAMSPSREPQLGDRKP